MKILLSKQQKLITFFGKGHWSPKAQKYVPSTRPQMMVDVPWVGKYIVSERAKAQTEEWKTEIAREKGVTLEPQF